jgi:alginate O-acetyltransferase complex protein AlgI
MSFNSLQYAAFLPLVVVAYWVLPRRWRLPLLLTTSYVFYGWWAWRFALLLGFTTTVDWAIGRWMGERPDASADGAAGMDRRRRRLVALSAVTNLGVLAWFKYAGFFVAEATSLFDRLGITTSTVTLSILLPVGVSFFTFQSLSYVVDVYRGEVAPVRSWVRYATFVAFFPQLVAGPISRVGSLLPQLDHERPPPGGGQVGSGLLLILRGLVRKVVIADQVAPVVADAFASAGSGSRWLALAGIVGFAIQIYADFAAYSDIARGSARLFGIELVHNFRQPYLAASVTAFWRRWHISLSTWLRDYLYVPLGGNRGGRWATARNLFVTMVLGGFWHGAGWGFLAWGALHGAYLVGERLAGVRPRADDAMGWPGVRRLPGLAWTLLAVGVAWVFFRAPTFGDALAMLGDLGSGSGVAATAGQLWIVALAVAASLAIDAAEIRWGSTLQPARRHPVLTGATAGMALVALLVASGTAPTPFIYFQF